MYEDTTYEVILERMLARVSDKLDKREGSVIWDTHSPTAIELQILYLELDAILKETYGDSASREFLILRCRERGIEPGQASGAVLEGRFAPENVDVTGARFNAGNMNYVVEGKIADGEYEVRCEEAGTSGNRYLGEIVPVDYVEGLETAVLTKVLIPGEDEEETEELRRRYFASFGKESFGGNVADYIEKTNKIPGVGRTKVTRIWNGDICPADMIPSEAVKAWYAGNIGTLPEAVAQWVTAVYTAALEKKLTTGGTVLLTIVNSDHGAASDTLVNAVQREIDPVEMAGEGYGLAPIGHVVTVKSAEPVEILVKTGIVFDVGYGWSSLGSAIEDAVSGYLLELRKQWADSPYLVVRGSQIDARILRITGIVDIRGTSINGTEGGLSLEPNEIPVFGGVSDETGG